MPFSSIAISLAHIISVSPFFADYMSEDTSILPTYPYQGISFHLSLLPLSSTFPPSLSLSLCFPCIWFLWLHFKVSPALFQLVSSGLASTGLFGFALSGTVQNSLTSCYAHAEILN